MSRLTYSAVVSFVKGYHGYPGDGELLLSPDKPRLSPRLPVRDESTHTDPLQPTTDARFEKVRD